MEGHGKDVYTHFAPSRATQNETRASLVTLRRFARDQQYSKRLARDLDIKAQEAQLFSLKETVPEVSLTRKRAFMGLCCENCTFISRESWVKKNTESLVITNVLQNHFVRAFDWNNNPPIVKKNILSLERIENAVEKVSRQQLELMDSKDEDLYRDLLTRNRKRAEILGVNISGKVSYFLLRLVSWALSKILPRCASSICVHEGQIGILREAARSNLPIIFLPSSESHLDHLVILYLVFRFNLKCPLVAVERHCNVAFIGSLLRRMGVFFIESGDNQCQADPIYDALWTEQLKNSLRAGYNLIFPIAKREILKVVLDSLKDRTLDDVLLVPVALNRDKLIGRHFNLNLSNRGGKIWPSIRAAWTALMGGHGMIRVDFNQPFSLREFVETFHEKHVYWSDFGGDKREGVEQYLRDHVAFSCNQSVAVMATNAVAFLLRTRYRDGATVDELSAAMDGLRRQLEYVRKDVGFLGRSVDVVRYGVEKLGPGLVSTDRDRIKPRRDFDSGVALCRYSDPVLAYFVLDCVIAVALRRSNVHGDLVYHDDLMRHVLRLCDMLRHEFLFCKPCEDLERVAVGAIDDLSIKTGMFVTDGNAGLIRRNRKMVEQLVDEDVPLKTYKVASDREAEERLAPLRNALGPHLEAYAAAASGLRRLFDEQLFESDLVEEIVVDIAKSDRQYAESARADWVGNALRVFEKWGVVEGHVEGGLRVVYLKGGRESVDQVCGEIDDYRAAVSA
ncbi:glycerol-3-phosphate acyltransferase 1, mitochondrial [Cylas formicarius]|uniref:glycerol-3-phosphate acyltransferase 1, mitochondrial n=1 Tax=Cylas formicarius TaxID=197179 RepID=UPI0029587109|nr:glycerol-3-phosphate acyltransferase 1, mitochondrial [Cylas formicarius]